MAINKVIKSYPQHVFDDNTNCCHYISMQVKRYCELNRNWMPISKVGHFGMNTEASKIFNISFSRDVFKRSRRS
jgi:hypothetical protein